LGVAENTLGAEEHDFIGERQSDCLKIDEALHVGTWNIHEEAVIGNILDERFVDDATACLSNGRSNSR
jgi:hypothetical protein